MRVPRVVIGSLTLAALPACGPSGPDLDQVTRDQREIFFKLGRLERSVEQAATQPAAAAAAPEPKYPDKVYDIPVGGSPVKGPAKAPVTIVEFSDFQCPPCGEARALVKQVVQEMRDGRAVDVDATPTFFVNGSRVGDRSFDGFKAMIERSLRAQPGKKG